jgi:hypothetical protein
VDEPGPDSGHRLTIDPGKHKGKNDYYYSFKTQFRGRHNDKSDHYHSFKT